MNDLYMIRELLYHNIRENTGFEVEWGFTNAKNVVQRKCKYVGLFPTELDSQ